MRTLRDMNLSKFVAEDVPLFLALIEDLFPGLKAPAMKHPLVEPAVKKAVDANNLQSLPSWMLKIIQVYEMCLVRHSLMLVGPSGTGKSRIVQVLQQAFQSIVVPPDALVEAMIGQPPKFVTMNPKAILSGKMFGTMATWPLASGTMASSRSCGAARTRIGRTSRGSCSTGPLTPSGSRT